MKDRPVVSKCGACFGTCVGVVEEVFAIDIDAFAHYSRLFRAGKSPQLCQKSHGAYHVCHLDSESERDAE